MSQVLPLGATLADLGCGIGGDSLALVRYFNVTGVDLDEARLVFAQANLAIYDRAKNFKTLPADLTKLDLEGYQALFFDPARRTAEGKRIFSVEDYSPPLAVINQWLPKIQEIGVKISPGVDYRQLDVYACEIETISDKGEVKEAVLWFGGLRSGEVRHRATLLPSGHTLINLPPTEKPPVPSGPPLAYLYEPDGAVIRAGLVEELALQLGGLHKLDPDIAYLTGETLLETPFARAFQVHESLPFNLKKLNRRLQELQIGRITIKKRGSPLDPQQLEHALKLKGDRHLTLILTHIQGKHSVLLCTGLASGQT
jgi:SAM-dependent methyltransferase